MIRLEINSDSFQKKNLIYRPELAPIRERIIEQVQESTANSVFYYDFGDIEAINISGRDELITKVLQSMIKSDTPRFLVLTNLSRDYDHEDEIDSALKRREVAVVYKASDSTAKFLGKVSDAHLEILEFVYRERVVTAREVADSLSKKHPVIGTQLLQLYKMRLVRREEDWLTEGGRQFRYRSLF